jgi:hypothetical protein
MTGVSTVPFVYVYSKKYGSSAREKTVVTMDNISAREKMEGCVWPSDAGKVKGE